MTMFSWLSRLATRQAALTSLVVVFFLAPTRLWNSIVGRIGHNIGESIYVLTLPIIALVSIGLSVALWERSGKRLVFLTGGPILIGLALVSALWAYSPGLSADSTVNLLSIIIFATILGNFSSTTALRNGVIIAGLLGLIASIVLFALAPSEALQDSYTGFPDGFRGVYLHKNYFGFAMALTALCALGASELGPLKRILSSIPFVVALGFSNSAGAGIAFLVGLVGWGYVRIFMVSEGRNRKRLKIWTVITSGLVVALIFFWPSVLENVLGKDSTLTGRVPLWSQTIDWVANHRPLGLGWGLTSTWNDESPLRLYVNNQLGFPASHAHNSFVEAFAELGFLGLAVIIFIVITALVLVVRAGRTQSIAPSQLAWIAGVLLFIFFVGLLEVTLLQSTGLLIFFTLGTVIATKLSAGNKKLSPWVTRI